LQVDGKLKLQEGGAFTPPEVKAQKTDAEFWKRHYWAAKKYRPNRTFNQVYGWVCKQLYRRISRNLPLMPRSPEDWTCRVGELSFSSLIGEHEMSNGNGQYDNRNSGVLFTNTRKTSDKHPDVNGSIDIDGVEYWVSGWSGVSSKDNRPYVKLRVRQKDANGNGNGQQYSNGQQYGNGQYAPPQPQPQPQQNYQYAPPQPQPQPQQNYQYAPPQSFNGNGQYAPPQQSVAAPVAAGIPGFGV
jgi:hypothetical protein